MVKIKAAEAEISWLLLSSMGQAPQMLGPTFPIMQPKASFYKLHALVSTADFMLQSISQTE